MQKPSIQQAAVYEWVSNGTGSAVIEAVAGAGKTTTLVNALKLMKGSKFFGAFNKKIADEISHKAGMQNGLTVSTMHAAGFKAWKKVAKFPQVEGKKLDNIFKAAVFRNMQYAPFRGPVVQLVSLAKQAAVGVEGYPSEKSRSTWQALIDHFDIETFDEDTGVDNTEIIIKLACKTLQASIEQNTSIIDFDDMVYAPLYHGCSIDKFDWVLLDEAQDTNASRRELALRMMKPTSRLVAVGDRHQAIYGFTGADSDALDLIGNAVNAQYIPLTVTFRCPSAVVAYSQQWVKHIQAHETAPVGIVRHAEIETLHNEVQVGDAILCRFNKPLVENVYSLIKAGVPARIEGRDVANGLKVLAQRWKVKSIPALNDKLDAYLTREVTKLMAKEQDVKAQAVEDKVGCLRVIIDRVFAVNPNTTNPVKDVLIEIENIFGNEDDQKPVVLLSSIHKSKGREWKKVVWLQTPENKFARQEWAIQQEANLKYVATTRAMHELVTMTVPAKTAKEA